MLCLTLQEGNLLLAHPLESQVDGGLGVFQRLDAILWRTPLGEGGKLGSSMGIMMAHDQFCGSHQVSQVSSSGGKRLEFKRFTSIAVMVGHVETVQTAFYSISYHVTMTGTLPARL